MVKTMARSYKRDKIGRFASTGGSGGKSRVGLETRGGKTRVVRSTEIAGTSRRGNTVSGKTYSQLEASNKTRRSGKYLHGADKVLGNRVTRDSGVSASASGRGISRRRKK